MKTISIIVPIYNSAATLKTCINSILQQTFEDFELLLIDDGSVDESFAICEQYETTDARVRIFRKQNGGVSSTRNFGIEKASGQFLFFMDSDDYIPQQYLSNMVAVIQNKQEVRCMPISCYCHFNCDKELTNEESKPYCERRRQHKDVLKIYFEGLLNAPWNKLFDRKTVNEYGIRFPEEISLGEDLLFNIAYIQLGTVDSYVVLCNNKYYYRQGNENSLSQKFYSDYFETQNAQYICLNQLADKIDAPKEDIEILCERYGVFLYQTLDYNMRKDNPKRFWQKMQDNSKIMQLEAFQEWIRKHQSQYKPFVVRIYLSGNYFWVWCLQKLLNIYIKVRYRGRK